MIEVLQLRSARVATKCTSCLEKNARFRMRVGDEHATVIFLCLDCAIDMAKQWYEISEEEDNE